MGTFINLSLRAQRGNPDAVPEGVQRVAAALQAADAEFVRSRTGFVIGGVSPVAHATAPVVDVDQAVTDV